MVERGRKKRSFPLKEGEKIKGLMRLKLHRMRYPLGRLLLINKSAIEILPVSQRSTLIAPKLPHIFTVFGIHQLLLIPKSLSKYIIRCITKGIKIQTTDESNGRYQ